MLDLIDLSTISQVSVFSDTTPVTHIAFDPMNLIFLSSSKPLPEVKPGEEEEKGDIVIRSNKGSLLQPQSENASVRKWSPGCGNNQMGHHLQQVNLATISLIESNTEYKYLEMGQDTYMTLLINKKNIQEVAK